jgi:hypothetical protein
MAPALAVPVVAEAGLAIKTTTPYRPEVHIPLLLVPPQIPVIFQALLLLRALVAQPMPQVERTPEMVAATAEPV